MSYEKMLDVWFWYLLISFCVNVVVVIWVTIGGVFDLRYLFKVLREELVDDTDDGRVTESYTMQAEQTENNKVGS
jgi:hypothetical protein